MDKFSHPWWKSLDGKLFMGSWGSVYDVYCLNTLMQTRQYVFSELVLSLEKQVLTAIIYSNILKTTILSSIITNVVIELYLDNV